MKARAKVLSRVSRLKSPYHARYLVDNCHIFQSGIDWKWIVSWWVSMLLWHKWSKCLSEMKTVWHRLQYTPLAAADSIYCFWLSICVADFAIFHVYICPKFFWIPNKKHLFLDSNTEVFKSKGFDIPLCIPTSLQDKHSDSDCQHWIHSDHCKDKSFSANTVVFWDHQSCLLQDCSKRGMYSYYRYWWSQLLISLYLKCIFVFLPSTALSHV